MEWISVKDRLPEDCDFLKFHDDGLLKFTTVLAVVNGYVMLRNRLKVDKCGDSYLDSQATNGWIWSRGEKSTHWMPLPDPPRSENA